ncbi:MAG: (d)CMP kinase [Luminiphilus sp.]|jgi:cytidylate kinase
MSAAPVICVDGPSGAGKGTLSLRLAAALDWHLLDSGALYRVVGFACRQAGVSLDNSDAVAEVARALDVDFRPTDAGVTVWLSGEDVTSAIRSEEGGADASQVAALEPVRAALLLRQQELARPPGLIADGRDMGTVVFPEAPLKIFLTASAEARAERRFHQLQGMGESVSLARLLTDIEQRDARDQSRSVSPLVPAEDAIVIDSTALTADEVLQAASELAKSRKLMS